MTLHEQIAEAGGLISQAGIAEEWGLTTQRVGQIIGAGRGFPDPVPIKGTNMRAWVASEVFEWKVATSVKYRVRLKTATWEVEYVCDGPYGAAIGAARDKAKDEYPHLRRWALVSCERVIDTYGALQPRTDIPEGMNKAPVTDD